MSTANNPSVPEWVQETLAGYSPLMTVDEACAALRCGKRTIYRYIDKGRLHSVRPHERGSSRRLITRASVGQFLAGLEVTA